MLLTSTSLTGSGQEENEYSRATVGCHLNISSRNDRKQRGKLFGDGEGNGGGEREKNRERKGIKNDEDCID